MNLQNIKTLADQISDIENVLKIEIEEKLLGSISLFSEALGPSLSINAGGKLLQARASR